MFGFIKTSVNVNTIVASLLDTVSQLENLIISNDNESEAKTAQILALEAEVDALDAESERANSVAGKLRDLLS